MPTTYRIHPGIGVARLGNSPEGFCISPEEPAALPVDCDSRGNPLLSPDGQTELRVKAFKDSEGRIKRQAARFQIWAYDEEHPMGRPLKLGDQIEGGGNAGTLVNIQWRVYLANKKASWYEFLQLQGEHGYEPGHPLRNAAITDENARQCLIIDPGPRTVDHVTQRTAQFSRDGCDIYAPTFPPPLKPISIDTLGDLLTDDSGRLLVLGGHGNSGSYLFDEFGQPRVDDYANNDGWFDDTSDGPVIARLEMFSSLVGQSRFVDVEYPAWVVAAYPAYVPQILDMVTMDDVIEDMSIREFAGRTDLYGIAGTFDEPQRIEPTNENALIHWRAGRLRWNPDHKPWFFRDIWRILYRPDEYSYLCDALGQSNYPHNQSGRGSFDPDKLGYPPMTDWEAVAACEKKCIEDHHSGHLFVEALSLALLAPEKSARRTLKGQAGAHLISHNRADDLQEALASFARSVYGDDPGDDFDNYAKQWQTALRSPSSANASEDLEQTVDQITGGAASSLSDKPARQLRALVKDLLRKYLTGKLLEDCRRRCIAINTTDPYRSYRRYIFDLLRAPGEENQFVIGGRPSSRIHNLPRMPLLCGDNPISNTLVSKFFRLTDYQFYLLRQWSLGLFYNEDLEGWGHPDPWQPYADWVNRTAHELDRGVITNLLGGSFCPGAEIGWVIRNSSIWVEPYRIKADPAFYNFGQTAAQANAFHGQVPDSDYAFYAGDDLSQSNDFVTGLQPGDLTKYMALPWQSDFNECSTQPIDVTYENWNVLYPDSDNDKLMVRERRVWETLWWPAHRPLQTWELVSVVSGAPNIVWRDWTPGVPQTNAGDLKMVTEWPRLGFVRLNPFLPPGDVKPTTLPPDQKYINVERTNDKKD